MFGEETKAVLETKVRSNWAKGEENSMKANDKVKCSRNVREAQD